MVEELQNKDFKIMGVITPRITIPKYIIPIDKYITSKKEDTLKLVNLDNPNILSTKNISKLQLAANINNDIIVLYDFSKGLNNKELQYYYNFFHKLSTEYYKKIILVSRDVDFLAKFCDRFVIYDEGIIYETNDIFDDNLYKYIDMPKIVRFIKLSNEKNAGLSNNTDLNELLKDIYRRKNAN